ncbi:hypothetical protein SBADM41S_03237 [Streptomyces badius]
MLIGGLRRDRCATCTGTPYLDTSAFARAHAPEGLLVYVEAAGDDAFAICRYLHGMRLAGFFDAANAVVVGRTPAPDAASLTQHEAVLDARLTVERADGCRRRMRPCAAVPAVRQRGAVPLYTPPRAAR